MLEKKTIEYEKAVLIGVMNKDQNEEKVNEYLDGYKKGLIGLEKPTSHVKKPQHLSFI